MRTAPPPLSRTHKPEALLMNSCPRLRPIQRAGGGGGGGGVLSAFGRFNERGGGGEVTVIDRAHAHAQYRRVNLLI